jgi:hypothetical protein
MRDRTFHYSDGRYVAVSDMSTTEIRDRLAELLDGKGGFEGGEGERPWFRERLEIELLIRSSGL